MWKEAAGVRTYFSYADEGLVAEFDASGNQIKSYGYRPGSTWTTDPLFMEQGGQYYFYHNDHLGTPQQMTSVSGAVVWAAQYGAFGQAHVDAGSSVVNNLRFPGQYWDGETGLHYNWNRYYDSGGGRYLRSDPSLSLSSEPYIPFRLLWELYNPQGLNCFTYVNNNSCKYFDPKGLAIWVCNRKTKWGIGNHAYLWDDRNKTCCGMGSTMECKESGPGKDRCNKVEGSDGKEGQIMLCCISSADTGPWFPPINDCHEAIDDCIKAAGLENPGAPGGRFGPPCDPCDEIRE